MLNCSLRSLQWVEVRSDNLAYCIAGKKKCLPFAPNITYALHIQINIRKLMIFLLGLLKKSHIWIAIKLKFPNLTL